MNRARPLRILMALVGVLLVAGGVIPMAQAATPDDELTQVIDPNQTQGTGQVVLDRGHIDFGPTLNTGQWKVQIHDDTASPSYWRNPQDVVLKVNDTAIMQAPDSADYSFLGLEPGTDVWVIPQTRNNDVIWAGWNTQEPNVLNSLNLGTTLRVLGVEGPGTVSVYLQSGNFGNPEPLWSSRDPFPQDTWIEINTHTHANWVFDKPGIYLVEVEFIGDLVNGETVSAHDTLRFAVGDSTDPAQGFAAVYSGPLDQDPAQSGSGAAADPSATAQPGGGAANLIIASLVGVVAAVLIIAVVVVVLASRRAKKRVQSRAPQPRASDGAEEDSL